MRTRKTVLIFLFSLLITLTSPPAAANLAPPSPTGAEDLTLEQAVSKAMANNEDIRLQKLTLRQAELGYDDAWDRMFLPNITLTGYSTSNNTIYQLADTQAKTDGEAAKGHGYPSSSIALNLGSYTLFNFWKDRIQYDIARLQWDRSKQRYEEAKRNLRFRVITEYFKYKTETEKREAAKRSVDLTQAILNLVKSKVANGTATAADESSANVDYLNAKNQLNEISGSMRTVAWSFNQLLGEPVSSSFRLTSEFRYSLLQITPELALKLFRENSSSMKEAGLNLKVSELNVELAEKNRLPLPTVNISGITFSYGNTYYGTKPSRDTTASSGTISGNIDISTTIAVTWNLLGPGGLFNSRETERARIQRDQAEIQLARTDHSNTAAIVSMVSSIRYQEQTIANLKQSFESSATLLESLIGDMQNQKVSRLEFRDAVNQARDSEFSYKEMLLGHLVSKLSLAETLGVDQLPGDSF